MKQKIWYLYLIYTFCACSGLEKSEKERIKKLNAQKEKIYRNHDDHFPGLKEPKKRTLGSYCWDKKNKHDLFFITKEYFRCKGHFSHPPILLQELSEKKLYYDCNGCDEHSLPVKGDKEFVYLALIDLLNYIQDEAEKKVIITCGHRCPKHNSYAEPYENKSKHLIAAEVDFYVEGMQWQTEKILNYLQDYYQKKWDCFGPLKKKSATEFENKEVIVRIYKENQKRDFDNKHPYPYLSIELKYDRTTQKPIVYNWHMAHQTLMKY